MCRNLPSQHCYVVFSHTIGQRVIRLTTAPNRLVIAKTLQRISQTSHASKIRPQHNPHTVGCTTSTTITYSAVFAAHVQPASMSSKSRGRNSPPWLSSCCLDHRLTISHLPQASSQFASIREFRSTRIPLGERSKCSKAASVDPQQHHHPNDPAGGKTPTTLRSMD